MEYKYYTPSLEEFHVGFEFDGLANLENSIWKPTVFREIDSVSYYRERASVRVKYLDREDIESFGFTYVSSDDHYKSNRRILGCGTGDDRFIYISYSDVHHIMYIWSKENRGVEQDLFIGTIKNKSELKTLLKQLNIIWKK